MHHIRNTNQERKRDEQGKDPLRSPGPLRDRRLRPDGVAATGAQATAWILNGTNVTSSLPVELEILKDTLTLLLSKAIGTTIAIDCTTYSASGVELQPNGKAIGSVEFSNCTTELGGKLSVGCKPIEPIPTNETLEIATHEGETVIKATNGTSPFTTLKFNEETCTVPNSPVKGTLWILDCLGDPETELLEHLIEEGKLAASMLGGLTFGTEKASIAGSLILHVFDKGIMQKFSVLK
jgi:hypothetical protein